MKRAAWAAGFFVLCGSFAARAGSHGGTSGVGSIPPDVEMVNALSCKIAQVSKGEWQTEAIAEYANPGKYHHGTPWRVLLGVRKTLKDASADCDNWMKTVTKAQVEREKERAKVPIVVKPQVEKSEL